MDDIEYYEIRKNELEKLLQSSHSKTSHKLIEEAIKISDENVHLYINFTYKVIRHLTALNKKETENLEEFNKQFEIIEVNIKQVPFVISSEKQKEELLDFYQSNIDLLSAHIQRSKNLKTLEQSSIIMTEALIKNALFEFIFKPNSTDFRFDAIIELIGDIIKKLVPYLGDIKSLINLSTSIRKKNYLKNGDKLFQYLEQYIDSSNLWKELVLTFEKNTFEIENIN